MLIEDYVFNDNAEKIKESRYQRYRELKEKGLSRLDNNLDGEISFSKISHMYGRTIYAGFVANKDLIKELSEEDIALICDNGNTCFGANVQYDRNSGAFSCTIYID